MSSVVRLYECAKCGQRYPLMPYHPAAAPHGPNKECRSQEWQLVTIPYDEEPAT